MALEQKAPRAHHVSRLAQGSAADVVDVPDGEGRDEHDNPVDQRPRDGIASWQVVRQLSKQDGVPPNRSEEDAREGHLVVDGVWEVDAVCQCCSVQRSMPR